ncbi:MAG TPA: glycosyltransferase family 1 protein [Acidobacteriota bacterium]|jgi:glycosyltransferase involved in cell wall biosynthesis|nr:glycosyltransferase family 1 protein [Acidobacteriota bacterium]
MRIGVDACCWSNQRGFGRFTRELLRNLPTVDQGNDYSFFVDAHTAAMHEFPDGAKKVVVATSIAPAKAASASGHRSVKDLWALSRKVSQYDLDLFFFPAVYSYFPILNPAKIVVTIHDVIPDHFPDLVFPDQRARLFWRLKQKIAVAQADAILTVSQYSRQQIIKCLNLPESRVLAISEAPSAIFRSLSGAVDKDRILFRWQLKPEHRLILYVGGFSPHKNIKALLEAFHCLTSTSDFGDLKLVLVGDCENEVFYSEYSALEAYIRQLRLEGRTVFTGFLKDEELALLYNAASLVVLPSLEEGFGLPAVEAMACGAPVVCSNRGALPEIVNGAGILFDPLRLETIVNTLRAVLASGGLREEMRRRGLRRSADFRWEAAARKTAAIFTALTEKSRRNIHIENPQSRIYQSDLSSFPSVH